MEKIAPHECSFGDGVEHRAQLRSEYPRERGAKDALELLLEARAKVVGVEVNRNLGAGTLGEDAFAKLGAPFGDHRRCRRLGWRCRSRGWRCRSRGWRCRYRGWHCRYLAGRRICGLLHLRGVFRLRGASRRRLGRKPDRCRGGRRVARARAWHHGDQRAHSQTREDAAHDRHQTDLRDQAVASMARCRARFLATIQARGRAPLPVRTGREIGSQRQRHRAIAVTSDERVPQPHSRVR